MAKKHDMKKPHMRAKGGKMPMVEKGDGEKDAMFPKAMRKAGGKVKGKKAMDRPDKRARGGATSDKDPTTSAGKMSKMPYEAKQAPAVDGGGKGARVSD